MKNYTEVRNWLENFIPLVYGKSELGLLRIENLLSKLGNPEKKFKSIHVGGTSGKGSVCFYLSRLLMQKKLKVGMHISPHLVYIGERMQINGENIPVKGLIGLVNKVKPVIDDIKSKQPHLTPSYFEILVALSFLYFAQERVDIAVVEVGLGGRLDATNVLTPELSVITNIGLDHVELLGDTKEKIAKEKAGIIKNGVPVITAAGAKALKVIEKVAKDKKSYLYKISTQKIDEHTKTDVIRYQKLYKNIFRQGLYNVTSECFFTCLTALNALKIPLGSLQIRDAFGVNFGGRFEEIDEKIVIDGAHNKEKIDALVVWFRNRFKNKKVTLVIAFKKGKNWQEMLDMLIKKLKIEKVFATEFYATTDMGKHAAVSAKEIIEYVESKKIHLPATAFKNSQRAVFSAVSDKENDEIVLVVGSLFLAGESRTLWELPEF